MALLSPDISLYSGRSASRCAPCRPLRADLRQRGSLMNCDVIGLVALDDVLRVIARCMSDPTFQERVGRDRLHDHAGDPARFRVPRHAVSPPEFATHGVPPRAGGSDPPPASPDIPASSPQRSGRPCGRPGQIMRRSNGRSNLHTAQRLWPGAAPPVTRSASAIRRRAPPRRLAESTGKRAYRPRSGPRRPTGGHPRPLDRWLLSICRRRGRRRRRC